MSKEEERGKRGRKIKQLRGREREQIRLAFWNLSRARKKTRRQ